MAISLLFVWLAFRKIDYDQLMAGLKRADYIFVIPAVMINMLQFYLRALRWGRIVEPVKRVGLYSLFATTSIGYMANNILPARVGEFVRAYVLGKKEEIGVSSAFATIVVERLIDTFTVFGLMVIVFFLVDLPAEKAGLESALQKGGSAAALLFLIIFVLLFYFSLHKESFKRMTAYIARPLPEKISSRLSDFLDSFASGLSVLRREKHVLLILLYSAVIWFLAALPVHLILISFHYTLPFSISLFILVVLAFAVAVPSSPGFIGTFHFACAAGLSLFNVPAEEALSVAIILHAINFFPITIIGLFFLWKEKLSLKEAGELKEVGAF